jgi:hypothetical protein
VPVDWPGGVRHVDDASLICCFRVEREKACFDTAHLMEVSGRECPKRLKPQGIEYRREARWRTNP